MILPALKKRTDPRRIICKAVNPAQLSAIERLARQLEPKLAGAILKALQAQKETVDLSALEQALTMGRIDRVMGLLTVDAFDAAMGPAATALQGAVGAAGALAVAQNVVPVIRGVAFRFNQLNPTLVDWMQRYSFSLIRQINDQTRAGVRQYLTAAMSEGINPIQAAREVRQIIGLTDRQAQAVANFRQTLETWHLKRSADAWGLGNQIDRVNNRQVFVPSEDGTPRDEIDQRRLRDFRYDSTLQNALEQAKPLSQEQIDRMTEAYARKYLRFRSETIARTEAIRTTNVGVQEAWRQAVDQGKIDRALVRRDWIVAEDERLCAICSEIPDMNDEGVEMEQPFETPVGPIFLPPAHPNCRCTVFLRSIEPPPPEPEQSAGEP